MGLKWTNSLFLSTVLWGNRITSPTFQMRKLRKKEGKQLPQGNKWQSWDSNREVSSLGSYCLLTRRAATRQGAKDLVLGLKDFIVKRWAQGRFKWQVRRITEATEHCKIKKCYWQQGCFRGSEKRAQIPDGSCQENEGLNLTPDRCAGLRL